MRWAADRKPEYSLAEVSAAIDRFIVETLSRSRADPRLRAHPRKLLEAAMAAADESDSSIDD